MSMSGVCLNVGKKWLVDLTCLYASALCFGIGKKVC